MADYCPVGNTHAKLKCSFCGFDFMVPIEAAVSAECPSCLDEFARAALSGMLAGAAESSLVPSSNQTEFQWVAEDCYRFADAMRQERKKYVPPTPPESLSQPGTIIQRAIALAIQYGGNDGAHHKDWVIDQMVRILAGSAYANVVAQACAGDDGPDTYEWNCGIAP